LSWGRLAIGCGEERVDFFLLEVGDESPHFGGEGYFDLSDLIEEFWELSEMNRQAERSRNSSSVTGSLKPGYLASHA